jgi:hypothetical protein
MIRVEHQYRIYSNCVPVVVYIPLVLIQTCTHIYYESGGYRTRYITYGPFKCRPAAARRCCYITAAVHVTAVIARGADY